MTFGVRANVVSSFTAVKGAMIPETYEVLAQWDFELTKKANLDQLREQNYIGAHFLSILEALASLHQFSSLVLRHFDRWEQIAEQ